MLDFTPGFDAERERAPTLTATSPDAQNKAQQEKDAAQKKQIKEAKKIVAARAEQRTACFAYKNSNEDPSEKSMAAKLSHLTDLSPEALLGEALAVTILNFFAALFQREYNVQIRSFDDALALDAQKRARIRNQTATDDNVRVAYAPLRDHNDMLITDAQGNLVYPACYPVDAAGNIDYYQTPITNGTASRAAIRANGFVPMEDASEAFEIQMLKFKKDMIGAKGFTPEDMHMLNMYPDKAKQQMQRSERDLASDSSVLNRPLPRPAPTPSHRA